MPISVLPAHPLDAGTLARIQKRNVLQAGKKELGEAVLSEMMQRAGTKVFKIIKDTDIVGLLICKKEDDGSLFISEVAVDPDRPRQGIGRTGLVCLLKILDDEDVGRVTMRIHPDNIPARDLYLSLGFSVTERVENYPGLNEPRLLLSRAHP